MRLPALAAALLIAGPAVAATKDDVLRIEAFVERIGTPVLWSQNHSSCKTNNGGRLLGFYMPDKNHVVMCEASRDSINGVLGTMKHEGWHAIQKQCNGGKAALRDDQIRAGLTQDDRELLRKFYKNSEHRLEAEARAVATLPVEVWLRGAQKVCAHRL